MIVNRRLQFDEAAESDDVVEVDARVAKDEQVARLLEQPGSLERPSEDVIKQRCISGRRQSVIRHAGRSNVVAVVGNQLAACTRNRPKLQPPLRYTKELITLHEEPFVTGSGIESPRKNGLVVTPPKLALDLKHRQILPAKRSHGTTQP